MRQRSPNVKRLSRIPARGGLLAASLGIVILVVACGKPSTAPVPTVTRIASPANAPVIPPTKTPAPTEAPAQPTAEPATAEAAGSAVVEATAVETGSAVAGAGTAAPATAEAAATEAATPATEATSGSAESGDFAGLVGDVSKGKQLSAQCISCHSIDGSAVVGPTWKGLYGHEVTLSDGSKVTADSNYIAESIRDPNAQVVEGFPAVMPPFTYLSDQDIADLIAYIKTLEG